MPGPYDSSRGSLYGPPKPNITLPLALGGNKSIAGIAKVLVWRFTITGHGGSVLVSTRPNGAGDPMLEAIGIPTTTYSISWPWVYEAETLTEEEIPAMHIQASGSLTEFRYEVLPWER